MFRRFSIIDLTAFLILTGHFGFLWRFPLTTRSQTSVPRSPFPVPRSPLPVPRFSNTLRKQDFTLTGTKGHGLRLVIGGFRSGLCVSVFHGLLLVIIIMIDGSEKPNFEGDF